MRTPTHTPALSPRLALAAVVALAGSAIAAPTVAQASPAAPGAPAPAAPDGDRAEPLVISHRGASGYRPEHTLAAYRLAVEMGADYVEPDLVSTKDGVLVARHENEISGTTDVAERPEFADRRTTRTIDGREVTGWFTEDFTLAELKTLRAVERLPEQRPQSAEYDGLYQIPTFEEVIRLVQQLEETTGREIGLAPETKHPTYFDSIGLSLEEPTVAQLDAHGLDEADDPVVLQSFEITNLKDFDAMTELPIAQLVSGGGAPYDQVAAGRPTTYDKMSTRGGMKRISKYADWIAPTKHRILPRDENGAISEPSDFVETAHWADLKVVTWTLRAENRYLPANHREDGGPNAYGDLVGETTAFLDAGVDAVFADQPDLAVEARDAWLAD